MTMLRDALVVAGFDLGESLRSRKVIVLVVLYVLGSVGATLIFTEALSSIETELAASLLVARTDTPGSLTQALMESPELLGIVRRLVHDADLAAVLVRVPPIALLYGWVALSFAPVFVVMTSSDAIASEVASGSVRYALVRADRAAWALGKLVGQAAMLATGIALGGVAAFVTGWIELASFDATATALYILRYAATAFFFAFAHLGLALGVSQLTRSIPWSRALGLIALATVYGGYGWLSRDRVRNAAPGLVDSLRELFPAAHRLDLWRPNAADFLPAVAILVAMGLAFFVGGHLVFARRDA